MKTKDRQEQYVRTIIRSPEFDLFFEALPPKVKIKFDYVMNVVATIYNVSTKFVKHLENTDLYEMRISVGTTNIAPCFLL
jgi:hypothetical protein